MKRKRPVIDGPISLKKLAEHFGLNPATVSVVLNDVPGRSIPQSTRGRIKAAAREFNYQPSLLERSLRNRRTLNVGVLVPELGDGYHTQVMSGIGHHLMDTRRLEPQEYGNCIGNSGRRWTLRPAAN